MNLKIFLQYLHQVLECVHRNVSTCHYTFVTVFEAAAEEVCDESYTKRWGPMRARPPVT